MSSKNINVAKLEVWDQNVWDKDELEAMRASMGESREFKQVERLMAEGNESIGELNGNFYNAKSGKFLEASEHFIGKEVG